MTDSTQGFLGRWQARREAVAAEEATELQNELIAREQADEAAATLAQEIPAGETSAEETAAAEAEPEPVAESLPDPDSIEVGGSFARFMSNDVDPLTRTAALRALWKQPQYNHIDGLIEYALDYSNQPKLSADASLELAKKVFRHVVESATEEVETEVTAVAVASEDNLPEVIEEVPQNGQSEGEQAQDLIA